MNKDQKIKILVGAGDALAVGFATIIAFWIRFYSGWFDVAKGIPNKDSYMMLGIISIPFLYIIFKSLRLYKREENEEEYNVAKGILILYALFFAFTFAYREISYSRGYLVINAISLWGSIVLIRKGTGALKKWFFQHDTFKTHVLFVGKKETLRTLAKNLRETEGYVLIGGYEFKKKEDLEKFSKENIDEVIIESSNLKELKVIDIINSLGRDKTYKIIANENDILTKQAIPCRIGSISALELKETPLQGMNVIIKRGCDLCVSSMLMVLLIPIAILIAIAIKIDSKGTIFYKQERITYNGIPFFLYKFRSMVPNAEQKTGPRWAENHDSRITHIGNVLRKTNLDELPQLWNVFKGEMSLVGPRPERLYFITEFKNKIPRYLERSAIRAGMTGWAQINGYYGNTSLEERVKYDIYYMENWSLMLDIKILIKTIKLIFFRKN